MKHFAGLVLNVFLIVLNLIVVILAFSYFIKAEEYVTHSAGFVDNQLNPLNDVIMFTIWFIISEIIFITISKFQAGTNLSKVLISLLTIFIQILIIFYAQVLFEPEFPLTTMRLVTVIVGIFVITMSVIDILRYSQRLIKSRRLNS